MIVVTKKKKGKKKPHIMLAERKFYSKKYITRKSCTVDTIIALFVTEKILKE